jgi:ABC-type transport system involved in multi-copper enzyme maturation permease subunit
MILGPVFHSELLMTARRRRYYMARVFYGLFILVALWQRFQEWRDVRRWDYYRIPGAAVDPTASIKAMSLFAEQAFIGFAWAQAAALLCVIPALLAGVIADEHQRKTLHYLLASRLSSIEIVFGKLGARMLQVGVLLMMGVPIVALVGLFGGLDPLEVAYVYGGTVSMVAFASGLSMIVSVIAKRPRNAILAAYTLVAAWIFLPPFIVSIGTYIDAYPTLSWLSPINRIALQTHPQHAWTLVTNVAAANERDLWFGAQARRTGAIALWTPPPPPATEFFRMAAIQTAVGASFLILAVVILRPLRGGGGRWEHRGTRTFPNLRHFRFGKRPVCGRSALLWKEKLAGATGGMGWLSSFPVFAAVAIVLGAYLFESAVPAFRELIGQQVGNDDWNRNGFNATARGLTFVLEILVLVATACAAAVSVTSEREQDTWVSLTSSMLSGHEIVLGKIGGAIWSARRIFWILLGLWALGVVTGSIHPLAALAALISVAAFLGFTAALGVWISLRAKTSARALATTIVVLLVLNVGYLPLVAWLASSGIAAAGSMPYVGSSVLFSFADAAALWQGRPLPSFGSYQRQFGAPIVAMGAFSVAFYSAATFFLTVASFRSFDRIVDRPRRRRAISTAPMGRRPQGPTAQPSRPEIVRGTLK